MKEIDLYVWCNDDGGDSYVEEFQLKDEEFDTIVGLMKEYVGEHEFFDGETFTREYLRKKDPQLYEYIYNQIVEEQIELLKENGYFDDFDEEEEGCTIDEYIDSNISFGFWVDDDFSRKVNL